MRGRPQLPNPAELLQAGGRAGTGNVLWLFRDPPVPRVLKMYRCRRGRAREFSKGWSNRWLEKKRGAGASARCETERLILTLWAREGFAAPRLLDLPLPAGVSPPALWLEYCPGPTLHQWLMEPRRDLDSQRMMLARVGAEVARRHRRAQELNEPLLIQEHATTAHLIVQDDRLVVFDLENGFLPGFPLTEAMAQEISGLLRPVLRLNAERVDPYLRAFVSGYRDPARLREIARHAVSCPGWNRRIKRWHDQRHRSAWPKTEVMRRLLATLDAAV